MSFVKFIIKMAFIFEFVSRPPTLNPEERIKNENNMSVTFFTIALSTSIKPKFLMQVTKIFMLIKVRHFLQKINFT